MQMRIGKLIFKTPEGFPGSLLLFQAAEEYENGIKKNILR